MAPILFKTDMSPPVRSVLLTIKAINLELEYKDLDMASGEHMKPDFLKVNPQHTVPTLVDVEVTIFDSHAICAYLVSKYSKDKSLYPEDFKTRALVDQRLYFDTSILFPMLRNIAKPIFKKEVKAPVPERVTEALVGYRLLEIFLEDQDWIAGNSLTIADLCIIATASSLDFFVPVTVEEYPNVWSWMRRCQSLPFYHANQDGLNKFIHSYELLMS